ncbi:tetratricopeptide repeat protein [Dyella sp. C11]|uniref:tetratricopeptide repeat protein n=1 Tax=Dyella sp. C11 TaxID=2126991 RepID=UPI000D645662|nr:tetratricopeptide repeat protein [Dyella sp. C11]
MAQTVKERDEFPQLLRFDPSRAFAMLRVQALAGDRASQLALGQMHLAGIGCERDGVEARHWFQRAAHQGDAMAMNMLGRCLEQGWGGEPDPELAAVWYRESADHGCDWGMFHYGHMLADGRGVKVDRTNAFHWFTQAANAGHGRAMHVLGEYYENGWETAADAQRAGELYRRSAEKGDYRGQCSWASVLTGQGRIDEACDVLRRVLAGAPTHFVESLREDLRRSGHAQLRDLALAAGE